MLVKDIMNRKVDVIHFDRSVKDAAKMMADGDYGALPVEKDDKMVGMITDRDIALRVVAENKSADKTKVADCMTEGIDYCFEDDDVSDLANKMKTSKHRRIPVVNRDKRLVGIVSTRELTKIEDKDLSHEIMEQVCH